MYKTSVKCALVFCLLIAVGICEEPDSLRNDRIPRLIESLDTSDIIARYQAGRRILKIGTPAVPYLVEALSHRKSRVRLAAIILLDQIGDAEAFPALIDTLQDIKKPNRERAAAALALGRQNAKESAPALVNGLKENSDTVRGACAVAIGMMREGSAIPALLDILAENRETEAGQIAMRVIKTVGNNGMPYFREILDGENGNFARQMIAIDVLGEIKSEQSMEILRQTLKSENNYLAASSAYVLSSAGDNSGRKTAEKLLKHRDPKLQALAAKTLENILKNLAP